MIVSQEWSGRIEKRTVDKRDLGRWVTCTLSGKGGRKLTMITAYQVVKDSITKCGPKTAYMQQNWRQDTQIEQLNLDLSQWEDWEC